MTIMVMTLSAVVIVSFGNQGMLINGQTNSEAMNLAQEMLEEQQELARKDFRLVQATSSTEDIYTKDVSILPWDGDQYSSKKVTVTVSWKDQHMIPRNVVLTTVLSNFMNAVGGDTCAAPTGNWTSPQHSDYSLAAFPGVPGGSYSIGGLDAYRGNLYVASALTSASGLPTFFVADVSNPLSPSVLGSVDNNGSSITGLSAVAAGNTAIVSGTAHTYVYAANAYGANFNTCSQAANCSQMQVFDVTNPTNPQLKASFKFATSSASVPLMSAPYINGSGGQAVGKSIFYKDGLVYLGLSKTGTGPEFTIINVHDPLNPTPISGYNVGYGVESVYVRGKYAYLATDDTSNSLVVLDISNPLLPTNVTPAHTVYNEASIGKGNAVYAIGDTLYLGKTMSGAGNHELFALNITNAGSGVPTPPAGGKATIGATVAGLVVRDTLAYVLTSTTNQLQSLKITPNLTGASMYANPSSISQYAPPMTMPGNGVALDCEKNYLFAASNNGSNGYVSVIKPGP